MYVYYIEASGIDAAKPVVFYTETNRDRNLFPDLQESLVVHALPVGVHFSIN